MNATILVLIALAMTSGAAFAQSAAYPAHADAAPRSVLVNPPASIDYASAASFAQIIGATNMHERATIIQSRADNR